MAHTNPRSLFASLLLCVFGIGACREHPSTPVTATTPAPPPQTVPASSDAPRVVPTAAQLVRVYQGKIEKVNGRGEWLRLEIIETHAEGGGIAFTFMLNNPDWGHGGHGSLEPTGRIRMNLGEQSAPLVGLARVEDDQVILETEALEGPPYWHFKSRPPSL